MRKKYISRTIKIQSTHKKSASGFAYAYECHPEVEQHKDLGSIFAVIEIAGLAEESKIIAEIVFNSLKDNYYNNEKKEALARFEFALGKVNEALVGATEDGKIFWLGKLNSVITVLKDKELHIAQTGSAEIYLLRKKTFTNIAEGLAPKGVPHPLKTFVNIASGDLEKGDKVVFYTPSLLYNLSKDELKSQLFNHSTEVAVNKFYHLLEELKIPNRLSMMVLEIMDPEDIANDQSDLEDEYWLDEPRNIKESVVTSASPLIEKAASGSKNIYSKGKIFKEKITKIKPHLDKAAKKVVKTAQSLKDKASQFSKKIPKNETIKSVQGMSVKTVKIKSKNISFKRFLPSLRYVKKDHLKMGAYALAVVVILVAGSSMFGDKNKEAVRSINDYKLILSEAAVKGNDAINKLAAGQNEAGQADINAAQELIKKVENSKFKDNFSQELSSLRAKLAQIQDQVDGIVGVNPEVVLALDSEYDKIESHGKNFYLFSEKGIGKIAVGEKTVKLVEKSSTDPISTAILENGMPIYITNEPMVYGLSGEEVVRQSLSVGEWYKIKSMVSYYSSIYVLGDDGKIYKHQRTVGGFTKPTNYLQTSEVLNGAMDLAIDSSIYVLDGTGQVIKFSLGKKQNFSLSGNPEIKKPRYVYTAEKLNYIYVFDQADSKVLVFDKDGKFIKKLSSDKFAKLSDFTSDLDGNVYFIAGNIIYKMPN